jgi:hypothetical protein
MCIALSIVNVIFTNILGLILNYSQIVVTSNQKGIRSLAFPTPTISKMKDMANGVILWLKKDILVLK